jgi:hypothetical protein
MYAKADGLLYSKDDAGAETALGGGGGSFTAAGTSGTPQTISSGDTLTIAAGTGINTTASASDTITIDIEVPVTAIRGGTGRTAYTSGDMLYANTATSMTVVGIGAEGNVLTVASGNPSWAAMAGIKQIVKVEYSITATGYSTTSTTFVDVDATNLIGNITTTGTSSLLAWCTFSGAQGATGIMYSDLILDSTTRANTATTTNGQVSSTTAFMYPTTVLGYWSGLSAAAHSVKLQYRCTAGTAYVSRHNANTFQASVFQLYLMEF